MEPWEGHWCISHASIRTMLGERLPVILEAFALVKSTIQQYLRNPQSVPLNTFVEAHKASLIVALQVDALAQTSLQIDGDSVQLYTVVNGEAVIKSAKLMNVEDEFTHAILRVVDEQDGEESEFRWENEQLLTEDDGIPIEFCREATAFFSDPELDVIEQLLQVVQQ